MYHLRQEFPTSGVWHLMIWGGADIIMIEIKGTINAMCLNHPETILPTWLHQQSIFHKTGPWCQKDWRLLPEEILQLEIPWLCSGEDFALLLPTAQVPFLVGERRSCRPSGMAPQKKREKKQNRNPLTDSISQNCAALDSALPTTTLKTSFSSSRLMASWRPPCTVWVSLAARVGGQERLMMTDEVSCI